MMLAGGIVEGGGGAGVVSAYVVLSAGRASRLIRVQGPASAARVTELPAATTVDLGRFQADLRDDLQPALLELRGQGALAAITDPRPEWVCGLVRAHLLSDEGIEVP